jgi:hypothetical protein
MKTIKNITTKIVFPAAIFLLTMVSCERDISDDVVPATFNNTAEIFTDAPVGLTDQFFVSFDPATGANVDGFGVDNRVFYKGNSSIRIDVPSNTDPAGTYIGGIFRDRGVGRDLTKYDALTFWAKGSTTATISDVGFGTLFGDDFPIGFSDATYAATANNIQLSTDWRKYTIPLPDPSKLVQEQGLFLFAAGSASTGGMGFTFWIDELKFEKLGTVAQPRPSMLNGEDVEMTSFTGVTIELSDLTQTFSLGSGANQTVNAAPAYFTFSSTDTAVAQVSELGIVTIVGSGTATITATLNGVKAAGSLTVESKGEFTTAPVPTRDPNNVISIFSDTYTNVPVDFFNGFWEPYQTTESSLFVANGNTMISYTNFNFVGNQFANPTVDASEKSNVHIDMYIPGEVPANMDFLITLVDFGADKVEGGGDDTREQIFFDKSIWVAETWITLEFPITMTNKSSMGLIIYENINFSSLSSFYLDNIYFYKD